MKPHKNHKDKNFHKIWNSSFPEVPEKEIEKSWNKFSKKLEPHPRNSRRKNLIKISSIAAVMLVLFSTYFFLEVYNPVITAKNLSLAEKKISLPDGSLVFLKKGASIQYKEHFRDYRDVKLEGSAYFNVAEDSLRPFRVSTGATVTRVLGTTFYIEDKGVTGNVVVSLFTGDVLVSVKNKQISWNIDPGEKFVFEEGETRIEKFNVNLTFKRGNEFIDVNRTALKKVHDFLSARFNYSFVAGQDIKNKKVTLRINKSDSLKQILKIIALISNTSYEINKETKTIQAVNK